jgi:hypothetical protein
VSAPAVESGDIHSRALLDCPSGKTDGLIVNPTVGLVCAITAENGIDIKIRTSETKVVTVLLINGSFLIGLSPEMLRLVISNGEDKMRHLQGNENGGTLTII